MTFFLARGFHLSSGSLYVEAKHLSVVIRNRLKHTDRLADRSGEGMGSIEDGAVAI